MKFETLDISIPFKSTFSHANYRRSETESFFIKVTSEEGVIGFGESCPRSYVTGETLAGCREFLATNLRGIELITDLAALRQWVAENDSLIDESPAAWCAIELALLDTFAKQQRVSVAELLNLPEAKPYCEHSAILGSSSFKKALLFRLMGFTNFKLKVTADHESNKKMFVLLSCLGLGAGQLRLDGNNCWQSSSDCIQALQVHSRRFWAIEEPVAAFDYDEMLQVARHLKCKIILDESLLTIADLETVARHKDYFIANVRISRLGGALRTIKIIERLQELGMPFIFGSHVGETSLLGSAQQMLVQRFARDIVAVEGGFSTWLLQRDPFQPNIKIGFGGRVALSKASSSRHGWGMDYVD